MLSSVQIEHFHTFGFLVIRRAFTEEEVEALIREAAAACAQKLGREIGEEEWLWDGEFVETRPVLTRLVEDDRIYLPVAELLGDDLIWIGSEGMWGIDPELADHTWHFDGHKTSRLLDYTRTKVMLYLDPQTQDTGALRVIPGSHRDPLHQALLPLQDAHLGGDPSPFGMTASGSPVAPSRPNRVISSCSTSGSTTRFTARRGNGGSSSSSSAPVHAPAPIGTCCVKANPRDFSLTRRSWRASVPACGDWPRA